MAPRGRKIALRAVGAAFILAFSLAGVCTAVPMAKLTEPDAPAAAEPVGAAEELVVEKVAEEEVSTQEAASPPAAAAATDVGAEDAKEGDESEEGGDEEEEDDDDEKEEVDTTTEPQYVEPDPDGEEDEEDNERLYADQEQDFEGTDPLDKEEARAKNKDSGAEYQRYLIEQRKALEDDPVARAKLIMELENIEANEGGVPNEERALLAIARSIQEEEDSRSRLEEQQRELVDSQRRAIQREKRHTGGLDPKAGEFDFKDEDREVWLAEGPIDHKKLVDIAKRRAKEMGHLDRTRRVAFMQHEMKRLLAFRETMGTETDAGKKEELLAKHEEENDELSKLRGQMPGSRKQLEDVWESEDGFDKESFDPKTFFRLHDITADGVLDVKELEAMFFREATKLHQIRAKKDPKNPKDKSKEERQKDKFIVREEMARMREHVMKKADTNEDGTVSFDEWMAMTERKEFGSTKEWKPVAPEKEMTDKQLANFKKLQAKLAASKHKEQDPSMMSAAKRLRNNLSRKQKRAIDALKRKHKKNKAKNAKKRPRKQRPKRKP